ncbi:unnamed protein product [Darwinula stevensoni]|uniref:Uncharacterized protein n=1 Tax=Darwinula stevensoni TaxID=69355 RepID=A0A7R8X6E4_9CRUS|nr:unnamed protein product [Darwinula stevensoni]CAG0887527.1 unnamed protein product [Darwinula stevensoni]
MRQMPTGKAVPAFGFLAVGLLMTWDTLARWHRSRLDPAATRYRNSLRFIPGRLPLDYLFIAVTCLAGIIEVTAYRGMGFVGFQHAGGYLGFFFLALVVIGKECKSEAIPPNADYAASILALSLHYILLEFVDYRVPLENRSVSALKYVILTCIVAYSIEMLKPHHITVGLFRCYAVLLQGTWYSQMAYIFSRRHTTWDFESLENVTTATVSFILQVVLSAAFILVLSFVIGRHLSYETKRLNLSEPSDPQVWRIPFYLRGRRMSPYFSKRFKRLVT